MNPMLLQLLQRFGPRAAGMLKNGFGTKLGMIQTPDPEISALPGQPQGAPPVAPPISQSNYSPPTPPQAPQFGPGSPNERVAQGFNVFGPSPLETARATPAPLPSSPALSAQAMAMPPAAPMPTPRPPEAPQPQPEMGFFQRNAAMMQDPNNPGSFIDPMAAQRAQASGPDVINKFLQMFKDKA